MRVKSVDDKWWYIYLGGFVKLYIIQLSPPLCNSFNLCKWIHPPIHYQSTNRLYNQPINQLTNNLSLHCDTVDSLHYNDMGYIYVVSYRCQSIPPPPPPQHTHTKTPPPPTHTHTQRPDYVSVTYNHIDNCDKSHYIHLVILSIIWYGEVTYPFPCFKGGDVAGIAFSVIGCNIIAFLSSRANVSCYCFEC